jgi:hypothetical protein
MIPDSVIPISSFQKSVMIGIGKSAARSALETTSKDALRIGAAVFVSSVSYWSFRRTR